MFRHLHKVVEETHNHLSEGNDVTITTPFGEWSHPDSKFCNLLMVVCQLCKSMGNKVTTDTIGEGKLDQLQVCELLEILAFSMKIDVSDLHVEDIIERVWLTEKGSVKLVSLDDLPKETLAIIADAHVFIEYSHLNASIPAVYANGRYGGWSDLENATLYGDPHIIGKRQSMIPFGGPTVVDTEFTVPIVDFGVTNRLANQVAESNLRQELQTNIVLKKKIDMTPVQIAEWIEQKFDTCTPEFDIKLCGNTIRTEVDDVKLDEHETDIIAWNLVLSLLDQVAV